MYSKPFRIFLQGANDHSDWIGNLLRVLYFHGMMLFLISITIVLPIITASMVRTWYRSCTHCDYNGGFTGWLFIGKVIGGLKFELFTEDI